MNQSVERTGRLVRKLLWADALILMAGSASSAALTYIHFNDHGLRGLALGVAVDIGLCVALIGDRQLHLHGRTSAWGRTLRIGAAMAALILNCGVAVAIGNYYLAFLHAFLPLLLIALMEYDQDIQLQFAAIQADEAAPPEPVEVVVSRAVAAVRHETDKRAEGLRQEQTRVVTALRQQLATERDTSTTATRQLRESVATVDALRRDIERDKQRDKPPSVGATTAAARREWVRQQRNDGHAVTGADVHKQFPDAPRDGARIVRQVELELDAELQAVATGGQA